MTEALVVLDFEISNVWPYPRPYGAHSLAKGKGKGPRHQIYIYGRPEFQQQGYYPQGPQFHGPPRPQRPHFPQGQAEISPIELQQYFGSVQREMQEFAARAYKQFQAVEGEINANRKQMEETLKSQFQSVELSLEAKQEKQIQQAVKDGKDELEIQECLAEEEQEVRADMDADIERTSECLRDASERALRAVAEARNAYTESSFLSSMQAREWAQKVKFCAEQGNRRCVEEGMGLIREKTKSTVQEGLRHFERVQEAPRQQMIQLDYCRQNFKDDLKDMREAYSQMVQRCVAASGAQEAGEEAQEEGKVEANVEVKPEGEVGVEVEA